MKIKDVMGPPPSSAAYSSSQRTAMEQLRQANKPALRNNNRVSQPRGRQAAGKGKVNLRAVAEVLEEKGLDPTVEIVRILKDPDSQLSADLKLKTLSTLMEYVHSKKKSVEVTGADGGAIKVEQASSAVLMQIAMKAIESEVIDVDAQDVSDE